MSKIVNILILGVQIVATFVATIFIYMIFALLDNDFGMDGLFGLFIFQPIFAIIVSSFTILICLLIGLPIRLNSTINYWWTTNFYVSIIGIIVGLALLILATFENFRETISTNIDEQLILKQIPNLPLIYIGWLLTAFSILHTYPPKPLIKRIRTAFHRVIHL